MTQRPASTSRPSIVGSDDTARSRPCAGSWTDPVGTAHFRELGTGLTFCGTTVDPTVVARATSGCYACVAESFRTYARHHECGPTCCAYANEDPDASGLERSTPQTSEEARIDRHVSWSGLISPTPEPCRDLELLERVRERLHHL